ncbi:MAG TPA: HupE/UreJ family protein [Steroidobacteraceae bacterium]|nr:HupE/UreJ family protein [Steroidobacteraceae bacterium]
MSAASSRSRPAAHLRDVGLARVLVCLALALLARGAAAHEMSMAEMEVRETRTGEFLWLWTASGAKPAGDVLTVHWPENCVVDPSIMRCGAQGLHGELTVDGIGNGYSAAMIKVYWLDGQSRVFTLTERQSTVHLFGSADDRRGMGEIGSAYLALGVEHILGGIDHLLFVASLLFLVGFQRRLIWTITAFTLAHSLTLASAALGLLTLRSAPVEASIALSIVLVASEALNRNSQNPTLAQRVPALVAFLFGLVHGLGFAGALAEIGLPQKHLATALVTFNLGVELGQLFAVGAVFGAWWLVRNFTVVQRARVPLLYGIGCIAAYWSWLRIAAMFS